MINLLIMILMAMSTGKACELGKSADYYVWVDAHSSYKVVQQFNIPDYKPIWLMQADDDADPNYYLFEFKDKDALNGSENQHGDCFQNLGTLN